MLWEILLVFCFGGVGCVSRYFIGGVAHKVLGYGFPYGTLIVNVLGSFFLPFFMEIALNLVPLDPRIRLGVAVGFFGGLTTFSSFSYESIKLLEEGSIFLFAANVFTNLLICLVAAYLGLHIARKVVY